jgi:MFS superfamily sulfate permease-like transporter
MDDIDYTGGETLVELAEELRSRNIVFAVADANEHLQRELSRFGVDAREFASIREARAAFHADDAG